jgi:hypothetical protein
MQETKMRKILILTSIILIYSNVVYAGLNVLLTAPTDEGYQTDILNGLSDFPDDFDSVVWWNMYPSNQPTLSDIETYDCVVTWPDYSFPDAANWGDTLADYVDGGGKVILCASCWFPGLNIDGRILSDGYSPFLVGSGNWWTNADWDVDNPDEPGNPCLENINSLTCGFRDSSIPLASWGHLVTHYQDDYENALAYNDNHTVAGINANPCRYGLEWDWTGDYPQAMRNTIVWLCSFTRIQPTSLGELKARFK